MRRFILATGLFLLVCEFVIGGSVSLAQRYPTPFADNGDFVLNTVDWLAGSEDLVSLRGRATVQRPFDRVEELRRRADERLLTWGLLARAYLWLGPLQAAAAMAVYFAVLEGGGWEYGDLLAKADPLYLEATTACLAAIVVAQVVNAFLCRHESEPAVRFRPSDNPLLVAGIALEIGLILAIVYTPAGNAAFGTRPLAAGTWLLMIGLALGIGLLEELRKLAARRRARRLS